MKTAALGLALLALGLTLPACAPATLLYCLAVDSVPSKKCQ